MFANLSLADCVLADASADGRLHIRHSIPLSRCHCLVGDWELSARPWEGGAGSLAAAIEAAGELELRMLELRNIQLSRHSLSRLASALQGSSDGCAAGTRFPGRAPHLRRLVLHANGLRASDMPALSELLTAVPSLEAVSLRSNLIGDAGARSLHALWPALSALQALEVSDADLGPAGLSALVALATRALARGGVPRHGMVGYGSRPGAGCFNLTLSRNRLDLAQLYTAAGASREARDDATSERAGAAQPWLGRHARRRERRLNRRRASVVQGRRTALPAVGSLALDLSGGGMRDDDAAGLARLTATIEGRRAAGAEGSPMDLLGGEGGSPATATTATTATTTTSSSSSPPSSSPGAFVTALDVRGNRLGDAGAATLAAAAMRMPRLSQLDARDNPDVGADGFIALLALAAQHPSITSLRLPTPTRAQFARRHTRQAIDIFRAMAKQPSLRELNFRFDWLQSEQGGLVALADALSSGSRLTSLDLGETRIEATAAAALARALSSPGCRLQSLGLSKSYLPLPSVVQIGKAVANCTTLKHVILDHNSVGIQGSKALIEAARVGGSLLSVSLVNAGVGAKWKSQLEKQLMENLRRAARREPSAQRLLATVKMGELVRAVG